MSEAERYQKSLYRAPSKNSKKRNPAEEWKMIILEAGEKAPSKSLQSVFTKLSEYDNVPRKEKQFLNFVSNSLRIHDASVIWEYINNLRKNKEQIEPEKTQKLIKENEQMESHIIDKKNTKEVIEAKKTSNEKKEITGKQVSKAVKKVLKKEPNHKLKMKELRRKVKLKLSLQVKKHELKKILKKEILNSDKFTILENKIVQLCSSN